MIKFNHINTNYSDFAYRLEDFFKLIPADQQKITKLDAMLIYALVRGSAPEHVLEIGRSNGTSTMIISGALSDNGHGHLDSVDIVDHISFEIRSLIEDFATEFLCDSKNILTHSAFKNHKYDLFFIDGDHSLEHQILDIETCLNLASDQAWFILHDSDLPETIEAAKTCCNRFSELVDIGKFGDQLYLIKKN
jgi:predicted O-methyltransferase YrrM